MTGSITSHLALVRLLNQPARLRREVWRITSEKPDEDVRVNELGLDGHSLSEPFACKCQSSLLTQPVQGQKENNGRNEPQKPSRTGRGLRQKK
jgi:hypothetical protein